ncbi:polysaccharide pyruvyl transferase family protein [Microbacterium sp. HD4P20]|uniref:polysaccharide pyruvyl transferase family protein n=1 Tax=Microbacterium sp. HD4P20 TaxID=2864874 RepID=UPI001C641CC5|nr:polysaccharide pyruvyl transferase family protein [Microbacterium sp. HD4P20]MCP2637513.1 polysaccharide pyruvyl transferase family protein [Microbacterium sp. HD4P20]
MFERRRRTVDSRPIYLISAAGLPNYGDEILTRVWLDWLAKNHPDVPVWLDCPEPGRANHLFAGVHPRLTTTNTLWHLAFGRHGMPLADSAEYVAQVVVDLGSPRLDLGLLQLREMRSVHLLGGGYMNSVWENHLLLLPALVALKQHFQVPIYATGQGVLPLSAEAQSAVHGWVADFDVFETRDVPSAEASGGTPGVDDAFLAFTNARDLYSKTETPDVMLLIQGDFVDEDATEGLVDAAEQFVRAHARGPIGLVESIPPDDSWILPRLRERGLEVNFYPFTRLWLEGLPARAGQVWLTTRFHFHLLAAAAGARGAVIELEADYYGIKHGSLRDLGTGWSSTSDISTSGSLEPGLNENFPKRKQQLARRKASLARRIYPGH